MGDTLTCIVGPHQKLVQYSPGLVNNSKLPKQSSLLQSKEHTIFKQAITFLPTNMKIRKRVSRSAEVVPSSAQIVVSIDDLLTEILLRLPIKSLLRFRLVSDHWCSLIVSPQIGRLLNPDPNPAVGLFFLSSIVDLSYTYIPFSLKDSRKNPPFTKLKFAEEPWGIRVLQSCNGLLLCRSNRARDCNR